MPDDYILRFIDLLRQFVAQVARQREAGQLEQALATALHAQEKLFALPAAQFLSLGIDVQLQLLAAGESAETSRAKRLGFASLLREMGLVYRARDRPDLATGAFQLSLHGFLSVGLEIGAETDGIRPAVRELLAWIPPEQLHPPVIELLKEFERRD